MFCGIRGRSLISVCIKELLEIGQGDTKEIDATETTGNLQDVTVPGDCKKIGVRPSVAKAMARALDF